MNKTHSLTMRICKFGGSSLAHSRGFRNAASLISSNPRRRVAVFSAPGARERGDEKVTDILFRIGERAQKGRSIFREQTVLAERFISIENDLTKKTSISEKFLSSIDRRIGRGIAELVSMGEEFSCTVMMAYMRREGIDAGIFDPATDLPVRRDENNNVFVSASDMPRIRVVLQSLLDSHDVVCAPGFYGNENGERRLFSRGGSDYTGAVLAMAINAERYEKMTDVDGIMDKDPAKNHDAKVMSNVEYSQLALMTGNGCGVVQNEAVELMLHSGIPMQIMNSFNPLREGTTVYSRLGEVA